MKPLLAMLLMAVCLLVRLSVALFQDLVRNDYGLIAMDIICLVAVVLLMYGVADIQAKDR